MPEYWLLVETFISWLCVDRPPLPHRYARTLPNTDLLIDRRRISPTNPRSSPPPSATAFKNTKNTSNTMAGLAYRTTPTPTPTDSWSSYFDSWRNEDKQVPAFEPMIVDDDLHPDSLNVQFNFNLDYDLDWEMMDLSQESSDRKMYDATGRLLPRRQYHHHSPSKRSPQHEYHHHHHNPRQVFRKVNNARQRPDHHQNDVDRRHGTLEMEATAPVRGTSLGANLTGQWLNDAVSRFLFS